MTELHRKCRISYLCEKKKLDEKAQSSKPTSLMTDTSCLIDVHLFLSTTIHQNPGLLLLSEPLFAVQPTRRQLERVRSQGLPLLSLAEFLADEMFALGHHLAVLLALLVPSQLARQATFRELVFATSPDLLHPLHSVDGGRDEVAVVLDGGVALLGELRQHQRRVHDHFLAARGPVRLGPLELTRLALHLEVFVAF